MPISTIEERSSLSAREFHDRYYLAHRPVILRSAARHWPAVTKWSQAYLSRAMSGRQLLVRSKSDYGDGGSKRHVETSRVVDAEEVIGMMSRDDTPDLSYVRQTTVWSEIPALLEDIGGFDCRPGINKRDGQLWMGPAGTLAQLHWDPQCNLFAQIRGDKRWILVPPEDSHLTYPNKFSVARLVENPILRENVPSLVRALEAALATCEGLEQLVDSLSATDRATLYAYFAGVNNCEVDAEEPRPAQTPRFLAARRHEATLHAGDAIFVPLCWRHCVRSLSPSLSVNWFFDPEGPAPASLDTRRTLLEHLAL